MILDVGARSDLRKTKSKQQRKGNRKGEYETKQNLEKGRRRRGRDYYELR